MEEKDQVQNKESVLSSPWKAILLFILFVVIIPFYESSKIILWETQRGASTSPFHSMVLSYAYNSERLKEILGLAGFFERDRALWLKTKESPVVFNDDANAGIDAVPTKNPEKTNIGDSKDRAKEKENAAEKTKEAVEPKVPAEKLEAPLRILIIGDSLISVSGGAGESLERELVSYKDTAVTRFGKVSSGLSRPDFFDWNSKLRELISLYKPNTAVVMFGSNDAQTITSISGGKTIKYGSEEWNKEYAARVSGLLDIFEKNNVIVFWVGLPIMKEPGYSGRIKGLDGIYQSEVEKRQNAYYISTWEMFSDKDGNYAAFLPDENGNYRSARNPDGIHISSFGGKLFAKMIVGEMDEMAKLEKK